jgi:hypothetical protein
MGKLALTPGIVAIGAVLTAVEVAAGDCPGDLNGNGRVSIDELVTSLNAALDGCPPPGARFIDNGDGTTTDTETGLVWEAKSDDGSIHDRDDLYTWSAGGVNSDGTAYTGFLAALNGERFAGYDDWRLPTLEELLDIVDYERFEPATPPAFNDRCRTGCENTQCSCTASAIAWSSTTNAANSSFAWGVSFVLGGVSLNAKTGSYHVRAVRGDP